MESSPFSLLHRPIEKRKREADVRERRERIPWLWWLSCDGCLVMVVLSCPSINRFLTSQSIVSLFLERLRREEPIDRRTGQEQERYQPFPSIGFLFVSLVFNRWVLQRPLSFALSVSLSLSRRRKKKSKRRLRERETDRQGRDGVTFHWFSIGHLSVRP